jgi:hypothetical protein
LASLVFAGLFSLVVVVGRMPPFDRLVTDPLFFKRGLVVHVNLALVAWFYAFLAALLFAVGGRRSPGWLARRSAHLAGGGVALMLMAAALPGARPVLSNYIPMIDHPLFTAGQLVFGLGVLTSFFGRRLLPTSQPRASFLRAPQAAQAGLRGAAAALLLAVCTFVVTATQLPSGLAPEAFYELVVWGGGHVLQLACTLAMLAAWLILLSSVLGRSPVGLASARALYAAMFVPWALAPLLASRSVWSSSYRDGFTALMQWSIFPGVCVFLGLCCAALRRARRDAAPEGLSWADPRLSGFAVSAALTLLGFGLGAAIRDSNTMVPAHYHASIGGVTAAFMTVTYLMLGAFGLSVPSRRLRQAATWQPVLYGVGQLVFAAGFAVAGAHGMGRKAYGAEQAGRGLAETVGLAVMGVGGLIAVAGGLLFLGVVIAIWRRGASSHPSAESEAADSAWRYRWAREIRIASIRSRG